MNFIIVFISIIVDSNCSKIKIKNETINYLLTISDLGLKITFLNKKRPKGNAHDVSTQQMKAILRNIRTDNKTGGTVGTRKELLFPQR